MRATTDREFMSEDEAKAFVLGVEYVNDGSVSVVDIEPCRDGYRVLIHDTMHTVDGYAVCGRCDRDIPMNASDEEEPYCNRHHDPECELYCADND